MYYTKDTGIYIYIFICIYIYILIWAYIYIYTYIYIYSWISCKQQCRFAWQVDQALWLPFNVSCHVLHERDRAIAVAIWVHWISFAQWTWLIQTWVTCAVPAPPWGSSRIKAEPWMQMLSNLFILSCTSRGWWEHHIWVVPFFSKMTRVWMKSEHNSFWSIFQGRCWSRCRESRPRESTWLGTSNDGSGIKRYRLLSSVPRMPFPSGSTLCGAGPLPPTETKAFGGGQIRSQSLPARNPFVCTKRA